MGTMTIRWSLKRRTVDQGSGDGGRNVGMGTTGTAMVHSLEFKG
jgi:hypothetical protein